MAKKPPGPANKSPAKSKTKKKTLTRAEEALAAREAHDLKPGKATQRRNTKNKPFEDQPPRDIDPLDLPDEERYRAMSEVRKAWDWKSTFCEMFMEKMGRVHLSLRQIGFIVGFEPVHFTKTVKEHPALESAWERGKAMGMRGIAGATFRNALAGDTKAQLFLLERLDKDQYGKTLVVDSKAPIILNVEPEDLGVC